MSTFYHLNTNGFLDEILEWKSIIGPKLKKGTFTYRIKIKKNILSQKKANSVSMMIGLIPNYQNINLNDNLRELNGIGLSSGVDLLKISTDCSLLKNILSSESFDKYHKKYKENSLVELYGEYLDDIIRLGLIIDDKNLGIVVEVDPNVLNVSEKDIHVGFSSGYYSLTTVFELYENLVFKKMLNFIRSIDLHVFFE